MKSKRRLGICLAVGDSGFGGVGGSGLWQRQWVCPV